MGLVLIVIGGVVGIVIAGYGGLAALHYVSINDKSCNRFNNIDNIETRIRIDIPSVYRRESYCMLDKAENTKTNYFRIRTDKMDMDRYVERNSFIPFNGADLDLSVFEKLCKIPEITLDNRHNFYYNLGVGKRIRTDWLAILDKNSGDLWVHMIYKD